MPSLPLLSSTLLTTLQLTYIVPVLGGGAQPTPALLHPPHHTPAHLYCTCTRRRCPTCPCSPPPSSPHSSSPSSSSHPTTGGRFTLYPFDEENKNLFDFRNCSRFIPRGAEFKYVGLFAISLPVQKLFKHLVF